VTLGDGHTADTLTSIYFCPVLFSHDQYLLVSE
jgi:hypothetical protein